MLPILRDKKPANGRAYINLERDGKSAVRPLLAGSHSGRCLFLFFGLFLGLVFNFC